MLSAQCLGCGSSDHEPDALFCQWCGASLDNRTQKLTATAVSPSVLPVCLKCGHSSFDTNSSFCQFCGAQITDYGVQANPTGNATPLTVNIARRLGAAILDVIWISPLIFAALLISGIISIYVQRLSGIDIMGDPNNESSSLWGIVWLGLLTITVSLYSALKESSRRQSTVGKLWMGFYISVDGNEKLTIGRALTRSLLKSILIVMPCFGVIDLLFIFITPRKQTLHDLITGCVMQRLSADAEIRRERFLRYFADEFPKVLVPGVFGLLLAPALVGFLIWLNSLAVFTEFSSQARRLFRDIR